MTPKQIWITVGAVAAALILGIGITLLATGGDSDNAISTAATRPTTPSTTVPFRLPWSRTRTRSASITISQWKRETVGSSMTRSLR